MHNWKTWSLAASVLVISCTEGPKPAAVISTATAAAVNTDTFILDEPEPDDPVIDTASYDLRLTPSGTYASQKKWSLIMRSTLARKYRAATSSKQRSAVIEEARWRFTDLIVNTLMPHWYGTPWDFEGHTDVPGQGEVACGYLVSTTLKHVGVNVNRYRLAQKSAYTGCKTLSMGMDLIRLRGKTPEEIKTHFSADMKEGLYQVGLDYHVGYVLWRKDELFFIHSSFLNREGVMITHAVDDAAFLSNTHYFVHLTHNDVLIRKWILNEEVNILASR